MYKYVKIFSKKKLKLILKNVISERNYSIDFKESVLQLIELIDANKFEKNCFYTYNHFFNCYLNRINLIGEKEKKVVLVRCIEELEKENRKDRKIRLIVCIIVTSIFKYVTIKYNQLLLISWWDIICIALLYFEFKIEVYIYPSIKNSLINNKDFRKIETTKSIPTDISELIGVAVTLLRSTVLYTFVLLVSINLCLPYVSFYKDSFVFEVRLKGKDCNMLQEMNINLKYVYSDKIFAITKNYGLPKKEIEIEPHSQFVKRFFAPKYIITSIRGVVGNIEPYNKVVLCNYSNDYNINICQVVIKCQSN